MTVDIDAFLASHRADLLAAAEAGVSRAHLSHYDAAGREATAQRVGRLLDVVIDACRARRLDRALDHADTLVAARVASGVELREVQTAINVIEECLWQSISEHVDPSEQPLALGLVSTVLGAIKDRVAQDYLMRSTSPVVAPVRVDLLFSGSEGNPSMVRR